MGSSPEPICLSATNLTLFLSIFLLGLGDLFDPSRIAHIGKAIDETTSRLQNAYTVVL